jgi:hypothetical protein
VGAEVKILEDLATQKNAEHREEGRGEFVGTT